MGREVQGVPGQFQVGLGCGRFKSNIAGFLLWLCLLIVGCSILGKYDAEGTSRSTYSGKYNSQASSVYST